MNGLKVDNIRMEVNSGLHDALCYGKFRIIAYE